MGDYRSAQRLAVAYGLVPPHDANLLARPVNELMLILEAAIRRNEGEESIKRLEELYEKSRPRTETKRAAKASRDKRRAALAAYRADEE